VSLVTDAVIVASWVSAELRRAIEDARFGNAVRQRFERMDTDPAGGSKFFQSDVWAAGFNYVSPSELEAWWATLPLGDADSLVLVANREGETFLLLTHNWDTT
jgi:hypothetical protein